MAGQRHTELGELGAGRFELLRVLGQGGTGRVYEARDRARDMRVALKTLRSLSPDRLYRFKREFRAVAQLHHANLVSLYELFADAGTWYFTMEIVRGVDFVSYARPPGDAPTSGTSDRTLPGGSAHSSDETLPTSDMRLRACITPVLAPQPIPAGPRTRFGDHVDAHKLRSSLRSLAEAVSFLHERDIVHRDLKPSNALVTLDGRVVLMDFGVVAETESSVRRAIGTPAFMAPEQVAGGQITPAADWYAFGVMLYIALVGRRPFDGHTDDVMQAKCTSDPPAPSTWCDEVPDDLEALCSELLARCPTQRPAGAEVLSRLGGGAGRRSIPLVPIPGDSAARPVGSFVGRRPELTALRDAFARTSDRRTVAVVRGPSGIGKTALIRQFLASVRAEHRGTEGPLILCGRCHQRETVPYTGFDEAVDALARWLGEPPEAERHSLIPTDAELLARTFPVLRDALALGDTPPPADTGARPARLRTRAFIALRELLRGVSAIRPVIVWIEDLQWADNDTIALLRALIRPSAAPARVMYIGSTRDERSAMTQRLDEIADIVPDADRLRIDLEPLDQREQAALVALLAPTASMSRDLLAECGGNPLFLQELSRYANTHPTLAGHLAFDDALADRASALHDDCRRLLEAALAAGEPTPLAALAAACGLRGAALETAAARLCDDNLLRLKERNSARWLDTYHDRIRECLAPQLPAERAAALHRALANELSSLASDERLARHWLAAGEPARAVDHLLGAAQSATQKLAFGGAADHYAAALEHGAFDDDRTRELYAAQGHCLAYAGRSFDSAQAYAAASGLAENQTAAELLGLAAEQLLRGGHFADGQRTLTETLRMLRVPIATSPVSAIRQIVVNRARLRLRGLRWTARPSAEQCPATLRRLDLLHSASAILGVLDPLRGAAYNTRLMREALSYGEPTRVCRSLANFVVFRSCEGGYDDPRVIRVLDDAHALAGRCGDQYATAWAELATAYRGLFAGRLADAGPAARRADAAFATGCHGARWERAMAYSVVLAADIYQGDLAAAATRTEALIADAGQTRDVFERNVLLSEPTMWRLVRDDAMGDADTALEQALAGWPEDRFTTAHYRTASARILMLMYQARPAAALELAVSTLSAMRSAMLHRVALLTGMIATFGALAAIGVDDHRRIKRLGAAIRRTRIPAMQGGHDYCLAALRSRAGDDASALEHLRAAAHRYESTGYITFAYGARYRLGLAMGGDEGAALANTVRDALVRTGVREPDRLLTALGPALPSAR